MKLALTILLLATPIAVQASGSCSTQARCQNGVASCSRDSRNTGRNGDRVDAYCGLMNAGDRHLTCWTENKSGRHVSDIVCCDQQGNAVHGAWNVGAGFNTAVCVGY